MDPNHDGWDAYPHAAVLFRGNAVLFRGNRYPQRLRNQARVCAFMIVDIAPLSESLAASGAGEWHQVFVDSDVLV